MAEQRRSAAKKKAGARGRAAAPAGPRHAGAVEDRRPAKRKAGRAASGRTPRGARKADPRRGRPKTKAAPGRRPGAGKPPAPDAVRYPSSQDGGLTEEERIESAKYTAPSSARVFEEERFVFPETYGVNRVRLLVKDPAWLFVHWDVNPEAVRQLGAEVGTRAVELSKLTLRVFDPSNGGGAVILVPAGARSWYVRADAKRRAYRAELGLTLPSGEFRLLAESNTVVTPRVGPSSERASQVASYRGGRALAGRRGRSTAEEEIRSASARGSAWKPAPDRLTPETDEWAASSEARAGASDSFRPSGGASDVHRR